jgi:hypothetical protein
MHGAQKALFISPLCRRRVSQKPVCVSVNAFIGPAQAPLSVVENFDNRIFRITESQFSLCKLIRLSRVEFFTQKIFTCSK